jgi:hypothetical protein
MMYQERLRKELLRQLHQYSDGDPQKEVSIGQLALKLRVDEPTLLVPARQLAEKHWLTLNENPQHTSEIVKITMPGIEEAEKMQSFLRRVQDEYPFLYQACWSLATLIVGAILLWLCGFNK